MLRCLTLTEKGVLRVVRGNDNSPSPPRYLARCYCLARPPVAKLALRADTQRRRPRAPRACWC